MKVSIEDAGRQCPRCTLSLSNITFDRTRENLLPATIVSCSNCGHIGWQDEIEAERPMEKYATG